jgi:quercetin dioxygenase-like cupin family protein
MTTTGYAARHAGGALTPIKLLSCSILCCLLASTAYADTATPSDAPAIKISRVSSRPSASAPAQFFTGAVRLDPLFPTAQPSRTSAAYVTFEAGARSAWHTHPLGQTLVVTQGVGRVQQSGATIQEIRPGDVVVIPAGVKHWHGAAPTTAMMHIAIQESLDGKNVNWLEKVTDEQYGKPANTQ